ncbi:MAG: alanyl-tRNA editing protein [Paracoccaceae bacterium]|nr:alanyl-tRNA editing protein [Paracoccaceae bacterium]MDG2257982.1 alanyl-tRNA editing protein [Paracoccaceae bacterium]
MTLPQFRDDAYLKEAPATVEAINDLGGIILDASIFYPTGGGQPGDKGRLTWDGGTCEVVTTVKGDGDQIVLVPAESSDLPTVGTEVSQSLDWDTRYRLMRVHTALHLLSVVIPLPVTGGAITAVKGRLDFDMPDHPGEKEALAATLQELIDRDLEVTTDWITDAELEANPQMVKTMSVKPPMGSGKVRLIRIGLGDAQIDLQPCGGTHVARTSEIGKISIGKIEKKGRMNRRVNVLLMKDF